MAYTSIIPVRCLDRAVDYVRDKTKTTRGPKSLQDAVDYAINREKTELDCFETGLSCVCETAFEDMRDTVQRWQQTAGVQGYHLVQSFAEGEVTPELAHQIGVELAEQLLQGRFQTVVTTHLNTKHYHNHIVWCSVALDNGRKYHSNAKSYYTEVRARSDALCRKYGLSIIETKESEQSSIQTTQEVEIYFNFVGRFVPPAFGEVELTPEELEEIRKREERKDRLHQNYLKRKASGAQKRYEDKIKKRKKAEIEAKKAAIRAEDIAKGVFVPVSSLPQREPMKGVQTA